MDDIPLLVAVVVLVRVMTMLWLQINSANPVYYHNRPFYLLQFFFYRSFNTSKRHPSHISPWQHSHRRKYTENTYQPFIFDQTWAHHFCSHVFSQNKSAWAGKQREYMEIPSVSPLASHVYKTQPHLSNDIGRSLDTSRARQLYIFFQ